VVHEHRRDEDCKTPVAEGAGTLRNTVLRDDKGDEECAKAVGLQLPLSAMPFWMKKAEREERGWYWSVALGGETD
jgi:hypothetical protein